MGKKHVETEMTSQKSGFTQVPKDFFIVWCGENRRCCRPSSATTRYWKPLQRPREILGPTAKWWMFEDFSRFSSKDHPKNQDENDGKPYKPNGHNRTSETQKTPKPWTQRKVDGNFRWALNMIIICWVPAVRQPYQGRQNDCSQLKSSRFEIEIEGHPKCWEITKST